MLRLTIESTMLSRVPAGAGHLFSSGYSPLFEAAFSHYPNAPDIHNVTYMSLFWGDVSALIKTKILHDNVYLAT